jgi:dTDP-4-dehydrorhamnose 3,5-epimerase
VKHIVLQATPIPGCQELRLPVSNDARGSFSKVFQQSLYSANGLETQFGEIFFTVSNAGVLRGMHAQLPPSDHAKVVYCLTGAVLDVVLDLRKGSPTFGRHACFALTGNSGTAIYMPRGIAHGFYVQEGPAIMMYHVGSEHDPARDAGIHWDSFGMEWPDRHPVVSTRDAVLPRFGEFATPFQFLDPPRT